MAQKGEEVCFDIVIDRGPKDRGSVASYWCMHVCKVCTYSQSAAFSSYSVASGCKLASLAGPTAARFACPHPSPLAALAYPPSPTPLGCKTSQTFSKTSASMASEVTEAGLTRPISLRRPS